MVKEKTQVCHVCNKSKNNSDIIIGDSIRPSIAAIIRKKHPDWSSSKYICRDDYNIFRHEYLKHVLETERGELSKLDKEVLKSLTKHEIISKNIDSEFQPKLSLADRLSDRLASFGGSWKFIIVFGLIIIVWISINALAIFSRPFDPYPFILLNLILSCIAALQAPIIMMSQHRLEERDRLRGMHDYKIDLKAELEIRHLHEKIDHLISNQWKRLLEIQQVQIEMLEEMRHKMK